MDCVQLQCDNGIILVKQEFLHGPLVGITASGNMVGANGQCGMIVAGIIIVEFITYEIDIANDAVIHRCA